MDYKEYKDCIEDEKFLDDLLTCTNTVKPLETNHNTLIRVHLTKITNHKSIS